MAKHSVVARLVAALTLLGWAAFWFWAFSFAYSDSFFEYNHHSRIPTFLAALLAAILVPISAFSWWFRASSSGLHALVAHVLTCLVVLALPLGLSAVLSRADHPWHIEADDAMGVGIDSLLLLGIAIASVVVMLGAIAVRSYRRRVNHPADAG